MLNQNGEISLKKQIRDMGADELEETLEHLEWVVANSPASETKEETKLVLIARNAHNQITK